MHISRSIRGVEAAHFIGHLIGLDVSGSPFLAGIRDDTRQIHNRAIHALARLLVAALPDPRRTPPAACGAVILLDDLHWADTSSLDVFAELLQIWHQAPILMVCGARPTMFTQAPGWRNLLPLQTVLRLELLGDDAVARLVSSLLRHPPDLPPALREMIVNAAEGNPFYVEELIKMLIEDGVIRIENDSYLIALERLRQVRVPPTLTGVLQARLDGLTPDEHEVLQCAAVIGRIFWDGAITMLAQDTSSAESRADPHPTIDLAACLDALEHKEMIFPRPTPAFAGTREYIFKHALLRDVAYEQVLRRRRRIYHVRAARWLEALTEQSGQADAYAALIADHYDQASVQSDAAAWYTRAGARAAAQFANVEALAHFSRALALVPEADLAGRYALLLACEQVYDLQGVRPAQRRDLAELAALAEALDDHRRRAEVALRQASFVEAIGDPLAAAAAAQRAIELARIANTVESEAAAYLVWGRALWHQAAYTAAQTQFAQCLALVRSAGLHRLEADSLHYLGTVALEQGDHRTAQTYFDDALGRFHTIGDRRSESTVLNKQGMVAAHQGDFTGARAMWERALDLFREVGDRRSQGAALQNLGLAAASQGDYGEARAMLDQALRCCRETGDRYGESSVLGNLGNITRAQGDYALAREYLTQALHLHSEIGDRERAGWALLYLSLLCHSTGADADALDYSRQALHIAQEVGTRRLQARALTQIGHTLCRAGRLDEATNAHSQALNIQRGLGAHNLAIEPLAGLAQVALDRADFDQARAYAEEVLSYLALITLDGTEEPLRVYLTCYQVLHAVHDPRADSLLDKAHRVLHDQASRIGDTALRRSFLEQVPTHHALEVAWAAHHPCDG